LLKLGTRVNESLLKSGKYQEAVKSLTASFCLIKPIA